MGIEEQIDRLIDLGEDIKSRLDRLFELASDHFADANKMVAEGPSTEAVRSDSLGDGYRIPSEGDIGKVVEVRHAMGESWVQRKLVKVLSDSVPGCAALRHCQFLCSLDQSQTMATCWRWARIKIDEPAKEEQAEEQPKKWRILEPGEVVQEGDWVNAKTNPPSDPPNGDGWVPAGALIIGGEAAQAMGLYVARSVADEPAKVPAWEPKVGDWVKVTRPENLGMSVSHSWSPVMDKFDGKVGKIESDLGGRFHICGFAWPSGLRFIFDRVWLFPAEPPATEKPAEPEYREPLLPADAGKYCQFSDDGIEWRTGWLNGWVQRSHQWVSHSGGHWRHCRIKVDA